MTVAARYMEGTDGRGQSTGNGRRYIVSNTNMSYKRVPILMYHSISDYASARFRGFSVSPGLFSEHISYLSQHQYTPLTITQFVRNMHDVTSLPERPIVLTFDDGFADFYSNALPVLKDYGYSATLYITTAYVGTTSRWLRHEAETDRPMLTWEELRDIHSSGIECGAHTHDHLQLDIQSSSVAHYQILHSKVLLEEHLGTGVETFAYPFGFYTAATRQMVLAAGYTSACAVKYTFSSNVDDPYALARIKIGPDTTTRKFETLLNSTPSSIAMVYKQSRTKMWRFIRWTAVQFRNMIDRTSNVR